MILTALGLLGANKAYKDTKKKKARQAASTEQSQPQYSNNSISERYAAISRKDFMDKIQRGEPLEDMLYQGVLDPAKRRERANEAYDLTTSSVIDAYDQSQRRNAIMRSRLNRRYSSADRATDERMRNQNEGADLIQARNSTKDYLRQEEMGVLSGVL